MKTFIIRQTALLLIAFAGFFGEKAEAQSILDPTDPIITYNPNLPPTQPTFGQIGKWVRTKRLNWTTDSYKAYFYKGLAFRLKFPKTYNPTANDGKKYPMIVFFHGLGETGTIYDNEFQLYHGGEQFKNAVDNGVFDGYIFAMQSQGFWGGDQYLYVKEIIDYMVTNNKLDPFQVADNGLSAGGEGTWEMLFAYPTYITTALPMSNISIGYRTTTLTNLIKYTPIWYFQGGLDVAPDPGTARQVRDYWATYGTNFKYTEYPNLAHGVWNTAWAEPDFYPYVKRAYGSNPYTLFGRTEFCPGDAINVTIGLMPGFDAYQWRRNGVLMPGATTNSIHVTDTATYDARILRGIYWSDWSRTPVHIKVKDPTVPPTITISGLMSKVIPALDNPGVTLQVPTGYASYLWQKVGSNTTVGTARTFTATTPGDYKVQVTEQFGCSTDFSTPFTVIDANGPNKPDAAINLVVATLSKTSLRLDWSDNPSPTYNETNFEVYQATQAGGPYKLIAITGADVLTQTATGLLAGTKYFYKVRAVNNTGAASPSNEANGTTASDTQAPTAPTNLAITGTTRTSIALSWTASTDDVAVTQYDIYINGVKSYITPQTTFTVYSLQYGPTYNFAVKARDFSNNISPFSNQVSGQALSSGLIYKYYTFVGTWNNLPDFNLLSPVVTGTMTNFAITPRTQEDNFAFYYQGLLHITTAGSYTFRLNSDDGSKLYLGPLNSTASPYSFSGTAIVNDDGLHGTGNVTGSPISLAVGVYPIAVVYYEQGGGQALTVSWLTPGSGSFVTIPNSAFVDQPIVNGSAPADPSGLTATAVSYKRIDLSWADNSNNETTFEIWRSTNATTGFATIGSAPANAISYSDSSLNATTTYYYKIRAINQYGESQLISYINFTEAKWLFNNNYNDASGNNRTLTPNNTPIFDAADKQEGTHSITFNGTSSTATMPTSGSFLQTSYNQKTIAFWMKSSTNTGARVVADIGGSDNGLALRLDLSRLYAGVASGSSRRNFFIDYTSTGWNHIALVYSGSTLKLYVNGTLAGSDNSLPFTSVGTTSNGSRIAGVNGSNAFNTATGFFSGKIDNFGIYAKALTPSEIASVMTNSPLAQSFATTLGLPAPPTAPTNLLANGISNSKINVTWTDATNESSYEFYRSNNNNSNYLLVRTLPANTTSYVDTGLFANSISYYKVKAVNVGGSAFSNEDSAITINNIPVIPPIADQYTHNGTQLQLNVQATDLDPEALTMQVTNLPAFGSYSQNGNGSVLITFNNSSVNGTYNNITVQVSDQHGGSSSQSFNLIVNNNYNPVIGAITNASVNELQTGQVNLSATDLNASDVLTWSFTGLPSFATPVPAGNSVQINLAPGYADNGSYVVLARVQDGNNGFDTASFSITVNDVNPNKKIYINFNDGSNAAAAPWNNTNKGTPSLNDNFPGMKDETGTNSGIGLQITSPWQNLGNATNTFGVNTGNNSGIYPDAVMITTYFTNDATQSIRIYGLNVASKYKFTFFGSRGGVSDDRTSIYSIGATSVSLNAANNSTNTASIDNVTPNPDGSVTMTLQKGAASSYGYLNAMVIQSIYDDGTAPAKPRNLAGQSLTGKVRLTWVDAAYNETAYEVYRATNFAGPYTLLNPGGNNANLVQFDDSDVSGNSTYYYSVRALNSYGSSPYSDTLTFTTPNASPAITHVDDVKMKTQQVADVNIVAIDDPSDVITLQVTGLPSFASFTDNGDGTGTIHIVPGNTIGSFSGITIIATDDKSASSSQALKIIVTDKDITSYYVNFNQVLPVGDPWNSFNSLPLTGLSLSNLKDDASNTSGVNITLVDGWESANDLGATTGNNSGVYPDNVMKTTYYESSTNAKRIRITGLATTNTKYNLIFFASRGGVGDNRTTTYTAGGTSVSLNAAGNTTNTVRINGLTPDGTGMIEFTAQKASGSSFAYINALVIQSYIDNGIPLPPTNLTAVPLSTSSIQLNWTDKSSNENGFEVYRATAFNGPYSLINTTAADVSSYLDAGLPTNTIFYYKVRAKKLPIFFSAYTNVAAVSTLSVSVMINFNQDNPASLPWNNTNNAPIEDDVYANLINNLSNPTGMNMTVMDANFSGVNPYGMNTGNNSGIYPDNVMRSTWWLDVGEKPTIKIDGLNQAMTYNFVFFASRDGGGLFADRTSVYTIGNKSASLNAINNISQTTQINGVRPDENGAVFFSVAAGGISPYAYIGALVIQGYTADTTGNAAAGITSKSAGPANPDEEQSPQAAPVTVNDGEAGSSKTLAAYPNPFADALMVRLNLEKPAEKLSLQLVDVSGKIVLNQELRNVPKGSSQYSIDTGNRRLNSGVYILRVVGLPGKNQSLKLIRK
jgi:large repetitive protein